MVTLLISTCNATYIFLCLGGPITIGKIIKKGPALYKKRDENEKINAL